jgi:cell filamentation protein
VPGYTLEDGETLKNKLGATTNEELERREADLVARRLLEMQLGHGPQGQFDADHLKAIHQHLFQDVYEWAGHTRDERVALSDNATASEPIMRKAEGQPFAIGQEIQEGLDAFAERLRANNTLRDLPREDFATQAADVMADLNSIHPFREGNGRTQRVFMEQLAEAAGHTLDFTVISKERMTQASVEAHENNDPSMMRRMFNEISDPERSTLLRESIEHLEQLNFNWNERYVATLTLEHSADLVFAGTAGENFMARTESAILFGRAADLPEPRPELGETFHYGEAQANEQSVGVEADATHGFQEAADVIEAGAAVVLEGVANLAGSAIETLADSMADLLGGGSSAPVQRTPAPEMTAKERREARIQAMQHTDQEQRAVQAQRLAQSLGVSE